VLAVPSTGAVDGRLLVVKVKEGFPWRFGGGAYYATVGQDNAFGERKSWRVAAGYNLAGLSWEDDAVLGSPFTYTAALCYANFLGTGFLDFHEFEGEFSAGVRAHPDLYFSLGSPLRYRIFVPEGSPALALFPYTLPGLEWFPQIEASGETAIGMPGLDFVFHAVCSSGVSICTSGSAYWNAEARGSLSCTMGGGCGPVIALKLSGGDTIALAASLPIYALFDLSNDPDHPMRSGYDSMELRARWFALLNAELRIPLPRIPLGTLFSVTVAPFLFLDAALAQAPLTDAARDLEGTGVGVRIAFENPVFAYFSLSYGWNLQGEGAFRFFADSGY
jgi:hypothetical protein